MSSPKKRIVFVSRRSTPTHLRVLGYFQSHLTATSKEAATALGVSYATVQRHVKLIRKTWSRPEPFLMDPEAIEMRLRNLEQAVSRRIAP